MYSNSSLKFDNFSLERIVSTCGPVRPGPFFRRPTSVNLAENDIWLPRFQALVPGTRVDVRNLKERSRSSQISLPTTSQALSVLPRTEVPFEKKPPLAELEMCQQ